MSRITQLDEFKIQSSLLFKHLKSNEPNLKKKAILRFKILGHLKDLTPENLVNYLGFIKRKHSLLVVALENGFETWKELKNSVGFKRMMHTDVYPKRCMGFTNEWFSDYTKAKIHLKSAGGYLFPYHGQYFIAKKEYIEVLGLNSADENWEKIDFDWAFPMDKNSWDILKKQLK